MKMLSVLLAISIVSNVATVIVAFKERAKLEKTYKSALEYIDGDIRIKIRKEAKEIKNKLDSIESKELTKEDIRRSVAGEVRAEVTKLAFTPINVKMK